MPLSTFPSLGQARALEVSGQNILNASAACRTRRMALWTVRDQPHGQAGGGVAGFELPYVRDLAYEELINHPREISLRVGYSSVGNTQIRKGISETPPSENVAVAAYRLTPMVGSQRRSLCADGHPWAAVCPANQRMLASILCGLGLPRGCRERGDVSVAARRSTADA